jgi:diacylglycerol kinase family enzyme
MGGDGSLATTVRDLRAKSEINKRMDKIRICLLPYGTGNDTASVFGWGSKYLFTIIIN